MAAIDDLSALLASLPNYSLITTQMKNDALAGARIPDPAGVWPGNVGYVNTYDTYFAAVSLVGFLRAQPVVRSSSSEGTSVSVDRPDWEGLLAWYRSMSPICAATGSGILNRVPIPEGPHVKRVPMNLRSDDSDNVDTDLG